MPGDCAMPDKPPRLTFYPFAYALLTDELCSYCWYCLSPNEEAKKCLGCGLALFCNKTCQTLGWKDHKAECDGFKTCTSLPDIETRILGRIVLRHKDILSGKDKKDPAFYKDRQSERSILEIWAHTDQIKKDNFAMEKFGRLHEKLTGFYNAKHLLPKETVFELHCRDYINRHAISDRGYMKEIGKGLYLDLCAYDHSCRPNTIYSCVGFVATLRALDNSVNITDKKTTFYSYIDLLCSQQERKKLLKDTWYFDCECERCLDSKDHILTSVLCPSCPDGEKTRVPIFETKNKKTVPRNDIFCSACSTVVAEDYVLEAVKTMRFVDRVVSDKELDQMPKKGRVEFLMDLLDRFLKTLPCVNVYVCRIIQHLIPFMEPNDHSTLLRLHLLSEECVRNCFPHNHPAVAFHLRNIGIFYMGLGKRDNAIKYITEAQEILEYTLDCEHPMTKENKSLFEEALALTNKKVAENPEKTKPSNGEETSEGGDLHSSSSESKINFVKSAMSSDWFSDNVDDLPELVA